MQGGIPSRLTRPTPSTYPAPSRQLAGAFFFWNPNPMNTNNNAAALHLLTEARDRVAEDLLQVLRKVADAAPAMLLSGDLPDDTPPWFIIMTGEASMPDGSVCWEIARAHLANLTTARLASVRIKEAPADLVQNREKATAHDLAKALGLNLYAFAGECWAGLGEMPMQEASHV